jgi:hypothetical protein
VILNLPLNTEGTPLSPLEQTDSIDDKLYWESDDTNPNQVLYDLENNVVIVPVSEDDIEVTPTNLPEVKKIVSRNVGNTQRRRFR